MDTDLLQHLEYNFASRQYHDLLNIEHSIKEKLKEKPKDIELSATLVRVMQDINMITPIIQGSGISILQRLEKKYGFEFTFLVPKEARKEKRDGKVLKLE